MVEKTSPKLTINGVEYTNFSVLHWKRAKNKLGDFEIVFMSTSTSDLTNIAYNKVVKILEWNGTSYFEVFKGYIRSVVRQSLTELKITGFSTAIKIYDRTWDERKEYTNIAANTIFSEINNGIVAVGTNNVTQLTTVRFELDSKLKSIAQIANMTFSEWWEDNTGLGADQINMSATRFTSTPAGTITVGTDAAITEDNTDSEKIYNCITVLGKGDGINQVKSVTHGFCYYIPYLAANITATATTITISSQSGFASSNGIIYINNEKIKYTTRTGTTLTGCTRGYGSTTAVAHTTPQKVWYAGTTTTEYSKSSPAPNSSVAVYGIREFTHSDKRIVLDITGDPNESCGFVAGVLFDKFKVPVRSIKTLMTSTNVGSYVVGKTFTLVDAALGINDPYKIEEIDYLYSWEEGEILTLTLNNQQINFLTDLDELGKSMDTSGVYGQGATNIYAVDQAENADSTHPLHLRFFLPNEAKAINKVLLNFKMQKFRAYNQSSETSYNTESAIVAASGLQYSSNTISTDSTWQEIADFDLDDEDCQSVFFSLNIYRYSTTQNSFDGRADIVWRMKIDGVYYPHWSGQLIAGEYFWQNYNSLSGSDCFLIPKNLKGKNVKIELKPQGYTSGKTMYIYQQYNYSMFERHSHAIDFGIYEEPLSGGQVVVAAGEDGGSLTTVGTYTTNQTEIDITSICEDVGVGNWIDIQFTPNKNMRIEANSYVQIYIESKVD